MRLRHVWTQRSVHTPTASGHTHSPSSLLRTVLAAAEITQRRTWWVAICTGPALPQSNDLEVVVARGGAVLDGSSRGPSLRCSGLSAVEAGRESASVCVRQFERGGSAGIVS